MDPDRGLLERVAASISVPPAYDHDAPVSILTAAAASYGSIPTSTDQTHPTGFDPEAAALFEALVEGAFLVANADGEFDPVEQQTFAHVVLAATGGRVAPQQVDALVADLHELLVEDGITRRIRVIAQHLKRVEHQREVLRVGALIAAVSKGISDVERGVLEQLVRDLGLESADLERAIGEAERALAR